MCCPALRKNIFTATAPDKSSTSAVNLSVGTSISLFQHITEKKPDEVQHEKSTQLSSKTLRQQPNIYTDIILTSVFNRVPQISDNYSTLQSNVAFATGIY